MFRSLFHRIDTFLGSRQTPARPGGARRQSLSVESHEARWVPSTSAVDAVAVPIAPASETGGIIPVSDQAVHGYKWRRPRPFPWETPGGEVGAVMPSQAVQEIVIHASPPVPVAPDAQKPAPSPAQAHAIDAVFSALPPDAPLMAIKK